MGNKSSLIEIKPKPGDKLIEWNDHEYFGAVGNFKIDGVTSEVPHGYGTMRYIDGSIYQGNFNNGQRSGMGTMQYVNGNEHHGSWKNGEPMGHGRLIRSEGDVLVGDFFGAGRLCGFGKHYYPSGRKAYEGNFLNGMYHGEGTCYDDDVLHNVHYTGGWISDDYDGTSYYNGYGVLYQNGTSHAGYYSYGLLITRTDKSTKNSRRKSIKPTKTIKSTKTIKPPTHVGTTNPSFDMITPIVVKRTTNPSTAKRTANPSTAKRTATPSTVKRTANPSTAKRTATQRKSRNIVILNPLQNPNMVNLKHEELMSRSSSPNRPVPRLPKYISGPSTKVKIIKPLAQNKQTGVRKPSVLPKQTRNHAWSTPRSNESKQIEQSKERTKKEFKQVRTRPFHRPRSQIQFDTI